MKKILLSALCFCSGIAAFGQCNELFISEYVEGYGNNRALEIYNPTANPVDLSQYSVGRFSNGATDFTGIAIPAATLAPYSAYTIVLDKRDAAGTGLETPIWNGYQAIDACLDELTNEPILDSNGDTVYCVQYDTSGAPIIGTVYTDWLDLEGRGDAFVCPVYNTNNAMYFNGDDAVALIKGTTVNNDGSNLLDVVGVIGIDPGEQWETADGVWLTKDKTLRRKDNVQKGKLYVASIGDNFTGDEWEIWDKNTFTGLGEHGCTCDPNYTGIDNFTNIGIAMTPNPAMDFVNISAPQMMLSVQIIGTNGQVVMNQILHTQQARLALNDLSAALYVVKINLEDGRTATQKLLVR